MTARSEEGMVLRESSSAEGRSLVWLGGMFVAVGRRAKERMEAKDLAV